MPDEHSGLHAAGLTVTAGELITHLAQFPPEMPVTALKPDGNWWLNIAGEAIMAGRPHPRPSRERLERRFIDGPPKTTPRSPDYHEFVRRLLADGYRFDMAAAEWVNADNTEYGRVSWDETAYWLSEPGTFRRLRETSVGALHPRREA